MKHYLLDTHVLLWSLGSSSRLKKSTQRILQRASGNVWLSPISVWEIALLVEQRRLRIDGTFRAFIRRSLEKTGIGEVALNQEVATQSREVSTGNDDPADRFIAATASVYELTLLTADEQLVNGKGYKVQEA